MTSVRSRSTTDRLAFSPSHALAPLKALPLASRRINLTAIEPPSVWPRGSEAPGQAKTQDTCAELKPRPKNHAATLCALPLADKENAFCAPAAQPHHPAQVAEFVAKEVCDEPLRYLPAGDKGQSKPLPPPPADHETPLAKPCTVAESALPCGGTYVFRHKVTREVMRTGRAKNLVLRKIQHRHYLRASNCNFEVVHRTDSRKQQRGLEYVLHKLFGKPLLDKIRPIAKANKNRLRYLAAAAKFPSLVDMLDKANKKIADRLRNAKAKRQAEKMKPSQPPAKQARFR